MKQLLQNLRTGEMFVADVPAPGTRPGGILVRNSASLISSGTEKASFDFARKSLIGKLRSQPDLARRVFEKAFREGPLATYHAAEAKLAESKNFGYSSAGTVIEVGEGVTKFSPGDRVACAGVGYANHAEVIWVPENLAVKIPSPGTDPGTDGFVVGFDEAAFVALGAIALQGVRRLDLTQGELVAVIGLGLVGQLTVQILHAYGFPTLGIDLDPRKAEIARNWGIELVGVIGSDDVERLASSFSGGMGVDAVIITAATKDNGPVELAGRILRERGRVSVVGDVGLTIPREEYYGRELDVRMSRSYGPGRYDPAYEEGGCDYPLAYARWTEGRNMAEFLRLVAAKRIDVRRMITKRFPIEDGPGAYEIVSRGNLEDAPILGVLLEYPSGEELPGAEARIKSLLEYKILLGKAVARSDRQMVTAGLIGAGSFAKGTILPVLRKIDFVQLRAICTATGKTARDLGETYRCAYVSGKYDDILADKDIEWIIVATRHDLHAALAVKAMQAGKSVMVEKPLALNVKELTDVVETVLFLREKSTGADAVERGHGPILAVGFNRRFSPIGQEVKAVFRDCTTPIMMHYRVSAGYASPDSWVHDPNQGGGRIIGEVCHFIDFMQFILDAQPRRVQTLPVKNTDCIIPGDNVQILIEFSNGSTGSILYSAMGPSVMPKEYVEIIGGGKAAIIDDFRSLVVFSEHGTRTVKHKFQDKGHEAEFRKVAEVILKGGPWPINLMELVYTTLTTYAIEESLKSRSPIEIDLQELGLLNQLKATVQ